MVSHFIHLMGSMDPASAEGIEALLDELDRADDEHFDVAILDESGWTLTLTAGGRLFWENVESDGPPRHMAQVMREQAVGYFGSVATGDLPSVEDLPWMPGYG